MKHLTDDQWIELNKRGFIPGPEETEEEFLRRVSYCQNLKALIKSELGKVIPFSTEVEASQDLLKTSFAKVQALYDFSPEWIPVFFSNYQLTPWHGGCAWIFQMEEGSPPSAFLQMRQQFRHSSRYLYLYDREELMTHELAHVGRMAFEEPKFEEFFSYFSSKSPFRRWFGPIVKSSWESMLFVLVLFFIFLIDLSLVSTGYHEVYQTTMWAKIIPLGMIGVALLRLGWRHRQFSRALKHLSTILPGENAALAVMYRLSDAEIINFSRLDGKKIFDYVQDERNQSLRWRFIARVYFS